MGLGHVSFLPNGMRIFLRSFGGLGDRMSRCGPAEKGRQKMKYGGRRVEVAYAVAIGIIHDATIPTASRPQYG